MKNLSGGKNFRCGDAFEFILWDGQSNLFLGLKFDIMQLGDKKIWN